MSVATLINVISDLISKSNITIDSNLTHAIVESALSGESRQYVGVNSLAEYSHHFKELDKYPALYKQLDTVSIRKQIGKLME